MSSDEDKKKRNVASNTNLLTANRNLKQHLARHRARKKSFPNNPMKFYISVNVQFDVSQFQNFGFTNVFNGENCKIIHNPHYCYCDERDCDCRSINLIREHTKILISQYYRIQPFLTHVLGSGFFEFQYMIADFFALEFKSVESEENFVHLVTNNWKILGPSINGAKAILRSKFSHFQQFENMKNTGQTHRSLRDLCIFKCKKLMIRQKNIEAAAMNWDSIYRTYFLKINPVVKPFKEKEGLKIWRKYFSVSPLSTFANKKFFDFLNKKPIAQSTMPFFQFAPLLGKI